MFSSLIESMVRELVDAQDEIRIEESTLDDGAICYELRVAKDDLGKVIGKRGRTASAMRTILSAAARKHQKSAELRIVED